MVHGPEQLKGSPNFVYLRHRLPFLLNYFNGYMLLSFPVGSLNDQAVGLTEAKYILLLLLFLILI